MPLIYFNQYYQKAEIILYFFQYILHCIHNKAMDIEDSNSECDKKRKPAHSLSVSSESAFTKINQLKLNALMKKESLSEHTSTSSFEIVRPSYPPSTSDQHMSIESDLSGKLIQNTDLFDKFNSQAMQAPPLLNPYRMSYREQTDSSTKMSSGHPSFQSKHSASPVLQPPSPTETNKLPIVQEDQNQMNIVIESSIESESQTTVQNHPKFNPQQIPPNLKCKCMKSKCIQLYCECFSRGVLCNEACECRLCRNNPVHKEKLEKAKAATLQKNPEAFTAKIVQQGGVGQSLINKRGCNCKKTLCFKKYCQCFLAGVKCSQLCKCDNCLNGGQNSFKPEMQ